MDRWPRAAQAWSPASAHARAAPESPVVTFRLSETGSAKTSRLPVLPASIRLSRGSSRACTFSTT